MRIYFLFGRERDACKRLSIAGIFLFSAIVFSSCGEPLAVGKANEVVVLAEEGVWEDVEDDIRGALEREIFSARRETMFRVIHAPLGSPGDYRKWSKLIVMGSLEKDQVVADLLPAEVKAEVGDKGGLLYEAPDIWARNQDVFVLVVDRERDLPGYVRRSTELLRSRIDRLLRTQVTERMFLSGHNTELEDRLRDEYGFSLSLPGVYREETSTGDTHAIRFFNINPQRSVLVYWEDGLRDSLRVGEMLDKRMELGGRFYPGDRLVESATGSEWMDFHGHPALKFMGLWENRERLEGGTFVTRAFNCPESGRFFMLDTILFAPDTRKAKYTYMIQLDTIVDSFRCFLPPDARE